MVEVATGKPEAAKSSSCWKRHAWARHMFYFKYGIKLRSDCDTEPGFWLRRSGPTLATPSVENKLQTYNQQ